ncbi:MAG: hypothetical protein ACTHMO_03635 [Rhodanobacteraceae bacterium]
MDATRNEIDRHQTAGDQDETQWAKGPFDDGAQARIEGFGRRHAPPEDVIGAFARKSWLAGWSDADMGILADGLAMPVTK